VTVSGKTLTIYASAAQTSQPQVAQDVLAAERLAFSQSPASVGGYTLRLVTLPGAKISDDARTAIQDQSAIAYLGEVVPHSSYASLGITNAVDLLQVSPTDTALELTQATPAVPGAPGIYYQSFSAYGQTFVRVVPTSGREASAQVQEMAKLGVTKLYVADDGGPYGAAIANAVKHDAAGKITVTSSQSGADGVFYGSNSPATAEQFFDRAAAANPSVKLFGPSALSDSGFAAGLSGAVRNLYVSTPGFLPADLTPAGNTFVSQFTSTYHRTPDSQAIFGYEAMSAVLAVLREAGAQANNRSTVVHDFLAIKNRQSVLGTYSMNSNGDTSIAPFVFSRLERGKLVPFASVQG
jgi:branched-chain amino acid transport system substrate-binding protein